MRLIDFHTHYSGCLRYSTMAREEVTVVQSLMLHRDQPAERADWLSVGIHPMQMEAREVALRWRREPSALLEEWLRAVEALPKPLLAVGECGYDQRSDLDEDLQQSLFEAHIALSERLSKPLVIHDVGMLHTLLSARKSYSGSSAWVLHGFRGKVETLTQLLRAGIGVSLHPLALSASYAEPLLGGDSALFFFETDECGRPVRESYERASILWDIPLEKLVERVERHFGSLYAL